MSNQPKSSESTNISAGSIPVDGNTDALAIQQSQQASSVEPLLPQPLPLGIVVERNPRPSWLEIAHKVATIVGVVVAAIAMAALWSNFMATSENISLSKENFKLAQEALQQASQGREASAKTLELTRDSLKHNKMTSLYSLGQTTSKVIVDYPRLRTYFYEEGREELDDAKILATFHALHQSKMQEDFHRILGLCEMLGDFFEQAYEQQTGSDPSDWNSWWNYFCDAWDQSPVLQEYFDRRDDWYTVDDALRPVDSQGRSLMWVKGELKPVDEMGKPIEEANGVRDDRLTHQKRMLGYHKDDKGANRRDRPKSKPFFQPK